MKKLLAVVATFLLLGGVAVASSLIATDHNHEDGSVTSHSGRTNSEGCHKDNVHGGYHCH